VKTVLFRKCEMKVKN